MKRTTIDNPFHANATALKTLDDLRRFVQQTADADGSLPVFLWIMDTTHSCLEVDIKTQECVEHNGKRHDETGVIFQLT